MQRKSFGNMPCPIARSLERVGEWWSMLILRDALHGMTRFDEFQKSLGIAPNMLTRRLDALVEAGLLERRRYSEHPPRDEYVLTARGRDFRPVLLALMALGNRHFAPEGASVQLVDTQHRRGRPTRSWSTAPPAGRSRARLRARRRSRRRRAHPAETRRRRAAAGSQRRRQPNARASRTRHERRRIAKACPIRQRGRRRSAARR